MAIKLRNHSNEDLLRVDYSKTKVIKDLLHNWKGLERMSLKGDRVATCVLVDLKTALGIDPFNVAKKDYLLMDQHRNKEVLSVNQFNAIVFVLVLGYKQEEVSYIFGYTQPAISISITTGVKRISKYLCEGVEKNESKG